MLVIVLLAQWNLQLALGVHNHPCDEGELAELSVSCCIVFMAMARHAKSVASAWSCRALYRSEVLVCGGGWGECVPSKRRRGV